MVAVIRRVPWSGSGLIVPLWPWWWDAPGGSSWEWVTGISAGGACIRAIGPITAAMMNIAAIRMSTTPTHVGLTSGATFGPASWSSAWPPCGTACGAACADEGSPCEGALPCSGSAAPTGTANKAITATSVVSRGLVIWVTRRTWV
jgi:hypothetical protein